MTTVEQAIELGLSKDEYNQTIKYMDRIPNITELGIFSAMWSEHCSYKSSRKWLKDSSFRSALGDPGSRRECWYH